MDFQFGLFLVLILCLTLFQAVENATPSDEAVIECGNIHHIELQNFPQANASFSNGKCRLTCWIGNTILATDSIYEGRSCPEDSNGICRNGQCIGGQEEALHECGLKHNLDFHKMKDHKGTAFTNDQCMLKCVLDGTELSANHLHEGSPCPTNPNGVCLNGACVTQSTNPGPTVTQSPTTVTKHPIESFSHSKLKFLNISLESTDPPLTVRQYIRLFFREIPSKAIPVCTFYGNKTNQYEPHALSDIVIKLNTLSQLEIDSDTAYAFHTENFYPLLAGFYQNHTLAFGEKENFVSKFSIYHPKGDHIHENLLRDVELRFTIVFSN